MVKLRNIIISLALVTALAACQTAGVSFPNAKVNDRDQKIQTVSGKLSKPEGEGPFPAVVLLQTCGGMKKHITTDWPAFLTGNGYVTLAVDTLGARGHAECTRKNFMAKDYHAFVKDAYGALDYLAAQPYVDRDRIAVMGFSAGANAILNGMMPWRVRARGGLDFKAAIALYGICFNIGGYPEGSIPLMIVVGDMDKRFAESCMTAVKVLPRVELHVLPGVYHAFDSPEASGKSDLYDNPMRYDAQATATAMDLAKAFIGKNMGR